MAWKIAGEAEQRPAQGYDGLVWQWPIRPDEDRDSKRVVVVRITGTAMAMAEQKLPPRVLIARHSQGRSEVEATLEWPEPPSEIEVHSGGVHRWGGDRGPRSTRDPEDR